MKKAKFNRIDTIINSLLNEFSNIPNFDLTRTDEDANRLFNLVISKFSEIQDYKTLYQKYFIPSTNKAIVDTKKEIKTSIYKKLLNVSETQLKENYHDTIRLGYVGLFHKIENYNRDLLTEANLIFSEGKTEEFSIEKYFKLNHDFIFNNWYSDKVLHKINWICNCVKHYDGYPKKIPKYEDLSNLSENVKIKIDHHEFYSDIDYITDNYYQFKLSQVFMLGSYKNVVENINHDFITDDLKKKFDELEIRAKQQMK